MRLTLDHVKAHLPKNITVDHDFYRMLYTFKVVIDDFAFSKLLHIGEVQKAVEVPIRDAVRAAGKSLTIRETQQVAIATARMTRRATRRLRRL